LSTDGILEAENTSGEMYGTKRFEENLLSLSSKQIANERVQNITLMEDMMGSVDEYTKDQEANDDITLAVIDCDFDFINKLSADIIQDNNTVDSNWEFSFLIHFDTLKKFDPLPTLNQILTSVMGKRDQHTKINMILAEMYCNSLDHGLLELDSSLKATPHGFMEFYEQKTSRLEVLNQGFIRIKMQNVTIENGSRLTIIFEDSGQGFDVAKLDNIDNMDDNKGYCGRGYPLIKNYCESVIYNDEGNQIECVFVLER